MVLSGRTGRRESRQLLGEKRTLNVEAFAAANDPKRTLGGLFDHIVGRSNRVGGTVRPSVFAVLRFMISSNLVGN